MIEIDPKPKTLISRLDIIIVYHVEISKGISTDQVIVINQLIQSVAQRITNDTQ